MGIDAARLKKRLARHRVLLDTSVLISYFNEHEATHDVAVLLIDDLVRGGTNPAVVSPIVAMELMVAPFRRGPEAAMTVRDFLASWPNLTFVNVDMRVAEEAASLRAAYGFKAPDALIVATGVVAQVEHLLTNDRAWQSKLASSQLASMTKRIQVTMLADYVQR